VLIVVVAVKEVQMSIMEIIGVAVVLNLRVPALRTMLVGVG